MLVAGGGGGSADSSGGDGGYPNGAAAGDNGYNAAQQGALGGKGGTPLAGGVGGLGYCGSGSNGALGAGGNGGSSSAFAGAGGGGGYYGGGGGGAGCLWGGAGGGGGSSWTSLAVTSVASTAGLESDNGHVTISWSLSGAGDVVAALLTSEAVNEVAGVVGADGTTNGAARVVRFYTNELPAAPVATNVPIPMPYLVGASLTDSESVDETTPEPVPVPNVIGGDWSVSTTGDSNVTPDALATTTINTTGATANKPPADMNDARPPYHDLDGVEVPIRYGRHYRQNGESKGFGVTHLKANRRWDSQWQALIRDTVSFGDKYEVRHDRTEYWRCYDFGGEQFQIMVVANPSPSSYDGRAFGVITAIAYAV